MAARAVAAFWVDQSPPDEADERPGLRMLFLWTLTFFIILKTVVLSKKRIKDKKKKNKRNVKKQSAADIGRWLGQTSMKITEYSQDIPSREGPTETTQTSRTVNGPPGDRTRALGVVGTALCPGLTPLGAEPGRAGPRGTKLRQPPLVLPSGSIKPGQPSPSGPVLPGFGCRARGARLGWSGTRPAKLSGPGAALRICGPAPGLRRPSGEAASWWPWSCAQLTPQPHPCSHQQRPLGAAHLEFCCRLFMADGLTSIPGALLPKWKINTCITRVRLMASITGEGWELGVSPKCFVFFDECF